MDRFPYLAAEVKAYGLYGAMVQAWVARERRSYSGILFRSTAPHGRVRSDWPRGGRVYVRGKDETARFFRAFADAVEGACRNRGAVDVVSDYGDTPPEVGIHDDAWALSPRHAPHPAADLVAKLAVNGDLRLTAIRSWCRTVVSLADGAVREHYSKNPVLCILETRQAELLAESLRRFAEM